MTGNQNFHCSPKQLFLPNWKPYQFISPCKNFFSASCYVIPQNQSSLLKELKSFGIKEELIVTLDSASAIHSIENHCNKSICPTIFFISYSGWEKGGNHQDYELFLNWLKSLKKIPTFNLWIAGINTFKAPEVEAASNPCDAVYLGLGQTFAKEYPTAKIKTFNLLKLNKESLLRIESEQFERNVLSPIHITPNAYYIKELSPTQFNPIIQHGGFKREGCYLIIGGTGGLGAVLADYLYQTYHAKLILVSRTPPTSEQKSRYETSKVAFEQVDLTNKSDVEALFSRYKNINGIIHSALILDDAPILTMTADQLSNVLAPKVQGSINLTHAIAHYPLDFVLFFSSIQSFIANAGQSNYTAACLTKDAIAGVMKDIFLLNTKIINWGFWGEVGVVASDFYRNVMQQQEIGSIAIEEGLAVIEQCLQNDWEQVAFVKGSENALANMGILVSSEEIHIDDFLPAFNHHNIDIRHNKAMMDALDVYARNQFHKMKKPENILSRYKRLWEAVSVIEDAPSINKASLLEQYPAIKPHVDLLETSLEHFSDVVSGKMNPLSVLFPEGSFKLVEAIYRNNPVADYYNQQVATAVARYIEKKQRESAATINIIEIGAGTGSTSKFVLSKLQGKNVRYVYTDVSQAFLNKAKEEFKHFNFIDYKIFNVSEPYPEEIKFDIAIATNVIHATQDIYHSVKNVYELLNKDGLFLINEITERQTFATLTFGLTEGWWLSADDTRIPYSPLLSLSAWESVLKACGFSTVFSHGGFGQHVITGHQSSILNKKEKVKESLALNDFKQTYREKTLEHQDAYFPSSFSTNTVSAWLVTLIAEVMHMPASEIAGNLPFSDYGIDSLISLELVKRMNQKVGYVPATILFEYPNLDQLTCYFDEHHRAHFQNEKEPSKEKAQITSIEKPASSISPQSIPEKIKDILFEILHTPKTEFTSNTPFSDFGVDSLISLKITSALQGEFGYLPATILFEYPTIESLTDYLIENQPPTPQTETETETEKWVKPTHHKVEDQPSNDVAIIGIAGIFPDADTCDELSQLLASGQATFREVPEERWKENQARKSYTQKGAFIRHIDTFDHDFFKITPIEAERIDPQERLFLQTTYHALENAGLKVSKLRGQEIGCYVGVMNHGYSWLSLLDETQSTPSSLFWSIANRASYQFDWHGPSFAVDSACSSSLTALHTAVTGIQQGDCELAVVGGVNLIVHPRQFDVLCELHMLSRSEKCQPFAKGADGFVDGEGIVSIVLMSHQKALAENYPIYGIIRGTAINAGGQANGYTAPNPKAQAALIKKALSKAKLTPSDIHYIEAHGTGTELGDPIEIRALSEAFSSAENCSIPIGSIKGNLGHLESAAGLASVIKVLLQMQCQKLFPSIHCSEENPFLNLSQTPFYINKTLSRWEPSNLNTSLFASISSFGAGGANSHVVIESPGKTTKKQTLTDLPTYFFPLSAHSESALQKELINLYDYLFNTTTNESDLMAISYGYCCVRSTYTYRAGFIASDLHELKISLSLNLQQLKLQQRNKSKQNVAELLNEFLKSGQQNRLFAQNLINAFNQGSEINWPALFEQRYKPSLPPFPFDKHLHWVQAKESNFHHKNNLITQHKMLGKVMAPASFTFSLLLENHPVKIIKDLVWEQIITCLDTIEVQFSENHFEILQPAHSIIYSKGKVDSSYELEPCTCEINEEKISGNRLSHKAIYHYFKSQGYEYGPDYQAILEAIITEDAVHSVICASQDWGYKLSPVIIDAALQTAILTQQNNDENSQKIKVPFIIEKTCFYQIPKINEPLYCKCVPRESNGASNNSSCYDIEISNSTGQICITLQGVVSITSHVNKLMKATDLSVVENQSVHVFELN